MTASLRFAGSITVGNMSSSCAGEIPENKCSVVFSWTSCHVDRITVSFAASENFLFHV